MKPKECLTCGAEMDEQEVYIYVQNPFAPHSKQVCDVCAKAISELYNLFHSGYAPWIKNEIIKQKSTVPEDLRWEVYRRDGYKCQHCGSESSLTIDHVFPESRGGTSDPSNLQTLCRSCNGKKGAKEVSH